MVELDQGQNAPILYALANVFCVSKCPWYSYSQTMISGEC